MAFSRDVGWQSRASCAATPGILAVSILCRPALRTNKTAYEERGDEAPSSAQAENDDPQPQVLVAFGLRITNCEPSSPSV